eukprot:3116054-Lingulodinium_polyedra.AAC.1
MGLDMHYSDRVLRVGANHSEPTSVCNSILQGCGQSNSWARIMLYQALQDLHCQIPISLGQHVDDINIHAEGSHHEALE